MLLINDSFVLWIGWENSEVSPTTGDDGRLQAVGPVGSYESEYRSCGHFLDPRSQVSHVLACFWVVLYGARVECIAAESASCKVGDENGFAVSDISNQQIYSIQLI